MKLVYLSDLHLRPTAPINRKDDYVEEQFKKLDFVVDYANENRSWVIVGGDVFDRATNHPSWFINRVLHSFSNVKYGLFIIPGNHDLIGHSLGTFNNNTAATVAYLNNVQLFLKESVIFPSKDCSVVLLPFGCEYEKPEYFETNLFSKRVLVLHEPVFEDTVPFYMPDALTVEQLEAKYPGYDLYLAGDIHIPCQKSKTLVSGSMMRMTVAQKEHRPRFYVIDSETLETETVYIPINEDVWADTTEVVEDEGFKAELKDLALAMEERGENLDYPAVVEKLSGDHWQKFDGLINEYKSKMEK